MDSNKDYWYAGASLAGKQWTHAVKTMGPLDQITIVLSHEPVHLAMMSRLETLYNISKNVDYKLARALSQS